MVTLLILLVTPAQAVSDECGEGLCPVVEDLNLVLASTPSTAEAGEAEEEEELLPASRTGQKVYDANLERVQEAQYKVTDVQYWSLYSFYQNWLENQARYEEVGKAAQVPPELVAALHWRESHGDFDTYLHQGDPLGQPAVNHPTDIPVFSLWEEAAVHALGLQQHWLEDLNIDSTTADPVALASFAEIYNGLGYHNSGLTSPYVFSGTDRYTTGKFVSDGRYKRNVQDEQVGVMTLLQYLSDMAVLGETGDPISEATPILQKGDQTNGVEALQQLLIDQGYLSGSADGDFGSRTKRAVKDLQETEGLEVDGIAGPQTWEALLRDEAVEAED